MSNSFVDHESGEEIVHRVNVVIWITNQLIDIPFHVILKLTLKSRAFEKSQALGLVEEGLDACIIKFSICEPLADILCIIFVSKIIQDLSSLDDLNEGTSSRLTLVCALVIATVN